MTLKSNKLLEQLEQIELEQMSIMNCRQIGKSRKFEEIFLDVDRANLVQINIDEADNLRAIRGCLCQHAQRL